MILCDSHLIIIDLQIIKSLKLFFMTFGVKYSIEFMHCLKVFVCILLLPIDMFIIIEIDKHYKSYFLL